MALATVFVTGATGFIGGHLAEALAARGCDVRCLVRPTSRGRHLDRPGIVRVSGTLADPASYRHALAGCETVFHVGGLVAARSRADYLHTNGRGTRGLADACAALPTPPRLVYVSSLAAAGPPPAHRAFRDEDDAPAPVSIYGVSKRAGEIALERRAGRLPVTVVRPGIVFGPRDTKVAAVFRAIERTRLHVVVGWHTPRLSLIHVADLVGLLLRAAIDGERLPAAVAPRHSPRGRYFACDDREHPTYGVLGAKVARGLGRGLAVVPLPALPVYPVVAAVEWFWNLRGQASIISPDKLREATARSWAASAAKARRGLAFAPAATLDERLRETGDWFRSNGLL